MKRISALAVITTMMTIAAMPVSAQLAKNLYTLGLHMGFASFRASLAANETDKSRLVFNRNLTRDALNDAYNLVPFVNEQLNPYPLDINDLRNLITQDLRGIDHDQVSFEFLKENAQVILTRTNSIRDAYSGRLASIPQTSYLGHCYVLGVNLAIAEGQATVGEAARVIVITALNNAKNEAMGVNRNYQSRQLDLTQLNDCILLAGGATPMTEVYNKILSLRSVYQNSFGPYR